MLEININEPMELSFDFEINGVSKDNIKVMFRIYYKGFEYGIPGDINDNSIYVNIPPLKTLIGDKITPNDEGEIKLEIIANSYYSIPWEDIIKFINPFVVEAKIKNINVTPKIGNNNIKKNDNENIEERIINKIMKKMNILNENNKDILSINDVENDDIEKDIETEEKFGKDIISKDVEQGDIPPHKDELDEKEIINNVKKEREKLMMLKENYKKMLLKKFIENMTIEDVYKYLDKHATKNKDIQKVIVGNIIKEIGTETPHLVLKEAIKFIENNKRRKDNYLK